MGHFGRRPDPDARAGADTKKYNKEIWRGRVELKSPQALQIIKTRKRLDELEDQINRESDPAKREPLYLQYANLAASCLPEVFTPDEIWGIERYSMLTDAGVLSGAEHLSFRGSRPDFLPLHHLIKLLAKGVYTGRRAYNYPHAGIILDRVKEGKNKISNA